MTMTRPQAQLGRIETTRQPRTSLARHWRNFVHRGLTTEQRTALVLTMLVVAYTGLVQLLPEEMPFTALMLPLLLGSILLGPRTLPWFVVLVMLCLTVDRPAAATSTAGSSPRSSCSS